MKTVIVLFLAFNLSAQQHWVDTWDFRQDKSSHLRGSFESFHFKI